MRYPASEKLEIIRLVDQSHLPVTRMLGMLGIPRTTFYRWYDRNQTGVPEALEDRLPKPARVWNRIPAEIRQRIVQLALDELELSPRELAVRFTDTEGYFVSEVRNRAPAPERRPSADAAPSGCARDRGWRAGRRRGSPVC